MSHAGGDNKTAKRKTCRSSVKKLIKQSFTRSSTMFLGIEAYNTHFLPASTCYLKKVTKCSQLITKFSSNRLVPHQPSPLIDGIHHQMKWTDREPPNTAGNDNSFVSSAFKGIKSLLIAAFRPRTLWRCWVCCKHGHVSPMSLSYPSPVPLFVERDAKNAENSEFIFGQNE